MTDGSNGSNGSNGNSGGIPPSPSRPPDPGPTAERPPGLGRRAVAHYRQLGGAGQATVIAAVIAALAAIIGPLLPALLTDGGNQAGGGQPQESAAPEDPGSSDASSPSGGASGEPSEGTSDGSSGGSESQAPSWQRKFKNEPLVIAASSSVCQFTLADLDRPAVKVNGEVEQTDDLQYIHNCSPEGIERSGAQYLGEGPDKLPEDAAACEDMARKRAVSGAVQWKEFEPGRNLCAITDEGNVAWLRYVKTVQAANGPDLHFEVTLWTRE